jgi:hypothetical protein
MNGAQNDGCASAEALSRVSANIAQRIDSARPPPASAAISAGRMLPLI